MEVPGLEALRSGIVRSWFSRTFPGGPTPAQGGAWPLIARGENLLLVSPTGTGKTLAAFLAIVDRLFDEHARGALAPGLRCVYVSPLRSLGYDIERNLAAPLDAMRGDLALKESPVRVAVRTGDTSAYERAKQKNDPPHLLITTPESLSLLLSQNDWLARFASVDFVILDEIHALVPTKRGADLAVSVERLSAAARRDPVRIGLSATCEPTGPVARFLVGPSRDCEVVRAAPPAGSLAGEIAVESLLEADEAPHRGLTYRRLLRRLDDAVDAHRTTVIFANTRAFTERITHDLRARDRDDGEDASETVAAHHSSLDAARRREVEAALREGRLRAVVTSTSLELGVDIGTADLSVLVGLPGSVARCLQRVGRAGHNVGASSRGLMLAATPAEIAGAAVTARAAREGRVEPLRAVSGPLDVLCQQLIGLACAGEQDADAVFALVRRTQTFADLDRSDFDACLAFLSGDLAAPAGAYEPEPGAAPRWTAPRTWRARGWFGIRSRRVARWFRSNVGTILTEETARVRVEDRDLGALEASYAERLQAGDRFVLDGRALEFRRLEGLTVHARPTGGEPDLPRWTSDRQSLSRELASDLAAFRDDLAALMRDDGPDAARAWLASGFQLDRVAADVLIGLIAAQDARSEVPDRSMLLVEESPHEDGFSYAFHAPLGRAACEALGRATAARLGPRFGRDLGLAVADLGWSIRMTDGARLGPLDLPALLDPEGLDADVLAGLDRGDLPARHFRHVAATALMVLRRPEGGRTRVGGLLWVSQRLYPLVVAACPDHPLLRETRRAVLNDVLDLPAARAWLDTRPEVRFRRLEGDSPFTAAWIDPSSPEPLRFEPPEQALKRLHARLLSIGDDA
jgi:ATP-dependent Lhr-like helicase